MGGCIGGCGGVGGVGGGSGGHCGGRGASGGIGGGAAVQHFEQSQALICGHVNLATISAHELVTPHGVVRHEANAVV